MHHFPPRVIYLGYLLSFSGFLGLCKLIGVVLHAVERDEIIDSVESVEHLWRRVLGMQHRKRVCIVPDQGAIEEQGQWSCLSWTRWFYLRVPCDNVVPRLQYDRGQQR